MTLKTLLSEFIYLHRIQVNFLTPLHLWEVCFLCWSVSTPPLGSSGIWPAVGLPLSSCCRWYNWTITKLPLPIGKHIKKSCSELAKVPDSTRCNFAINLRLTPRQSCKWLSAPSNTKGSALCNYDTLIPFLWCIRQLGCSKWLLQWVLYNPQCHMFYTPVHYIHRKIHIMPNNHRLTAFIE